jgi:YidC/Oxa1 family membrane protein insertase
MFHTFVYQPILQALVFVYQHLAFQDLGIAIIILTLGIRIILYPLFTRGARDQALMQRLQPKIASIQKQHKENKETQAKALMELYRDHKLNPLSSIFTLLVQLPIFFALFDIFRNELGASVFASHEFLGILDLSARSPVLVVLAAGLQYFQARLTLPPKKEGETQGSAATTARIMTVAGPIITVVVLVNLPSAIGLYWLASTGFSILQQVVVNRKLALAAVTTSDT